MRKRIGNLGGFLGLVTILMLFFCLPIQASGENLKIGVTLPITGPCADIGQHGKRGLLLAVEEINASGGILGRQIELVIADDESNPAAGVAAAERLITRDNVDLMAGTYNSSVAMAVMDVPAKYEMPYIIGGATSDQIGLKIASNPKKFRACYKITNPSYIYGTCWIWFWEEMLAQKQYTPATKNITIVNGNSAWGNAIGDSIEKFLRESHLYKEGYRVVLRERVPIAETDFLAIMSKMKARSPGIAFGIFSAIPTNVAFQKQFVDSGLRAPVCAGYTPNNPEFIKLAGSAAEGLLWNTPVSVLPTKEGEHFQKAIWNKFGKEVEVFGSLVYDSIYIIKEAYERANSFERDKFLKAMDKTRHLGVAGVFTFDPKTHEGIAGEDLLPPRVYQIQNGKSFTVWPRKHSKVSYVVPSWMK